MSDYKLVKPVGSYRVTDPASGEVIPREGQMMRLTSWIRRRAREGSVTISDPPPAKPKPAKATAPTAQVSKSKSPQTTHTITDDADVGLATIGSALPRPPRRRRQTAPE